MSDADPRPGWAPPHRLLFAALYFSEGAPIGYVWWALPTKLRAAGVPVERVTQITALLVLPWALKFLWAPLLDAVPLARFGVRGWIIAMQCCMGLALLPLFVLDPTVEFGWYAAFLLLHAFSAATQDAAVDALAISVVSPVNRGAINAWMQVGMLTGRAMFGGVALYVEKWVGPNAILLAMLVCIWSTMILVLSVRTTADCTPNSDGRRRSSVGFKKTLFAVLARRSTWAGLAFAAFGGAAFEAAGAVAGPMLLDKGADQRAVGLFFAAPAIVCTGAGAFLGGRIGDRAGRHAAVIGSMIAIGASTASLALIFALAPSPRPLFAALGVLYIMIGAFTSSSYALFMDISDPRLGATQFSAFMGTTNLCEAWSSLTVGWLIARVGYPAALCTMIVPTILAIALVRQMRREAGPASLADQAHSGAPHA